MSISREAVAEGLYPKIGSLSELSNILGVSEYCIYRLAAKGVVDRVGRNQYAIVPSITGYCNHLFKIQKKRLEAKAKKRKRDRANSKLYRKNNKEKTKARQKQYNKSTHGKEIISANVKKRIANLDDSYVKEKIFRQTGIDKTDITPEMIEAKREILKAKRMIKEYENEQKSND